MARSRGYRFDAPVGEFLASSTWSDIWGLTFVKPDVPITPRSRQTAPVYFLVRRLCDNCFALSGTKPPWEYGLPPLCDKCTVFIPHIKLEDWEALKMVEEAKSKKLGDMFYYLPDHTGARKLQVPHMDLLKGFSVCFKQTVIAHSKTPEEAAVFAESLGIPTELALGTLFQLLGDAWTDKDLHKNALKIGAETLGMVRDFWVNNNTNLLHKMGEHSRVFCASARRNGRWDNPLETYYRDLIQVLTYTAGYVTGEIPEPPRNELLSSKDFANFFIT